ncbi:hypothetical protein HPB49_018452 [Dermacentor silvarum]|uniref:Uncharacterized protein n=1 Tax=Dermacentor silvarum TaxID=543639 RepID=A0ACB8DK73_DERSI|nr:hypothetical protein HPB49_018452 [Dermacentor silvarum]
MFAIRNGALYRRWWQKDRSEERYLLAVPKCFRTEILRAIHDTPEGGHIGQRVMLRKLQERFWWPTMQSNKERAGLFIDRLLCTCRNWLKQRDLLLPNFTTTALGEPPQEQKDSHRWAAFVSFLAGLLTAIPGKGKRSAVGTCHSGHIFCLAALLCESCKFIIHSPDLEWHTQIECLRSALKTAGKTAERAAPARMAALVACLRDEFLTPDASAETRLTLLELIELRASGWKFSAQQQLYYAAHSGVFGAECDDDLSPLPLPCRTAQ